MENNKIYKEGEFFNSENDKQNSRAVNENNHKDESLDDIWQRFIEAQRPETLQKYWLRPKWFEPAVLNYKRSKKVRRNTLQVN